jgi:hypothetical protein
MVPYDQGAASIEMLKRFIDLQNNGGSLCRAFDTNVCHFVVTFSHNNNSV